MFAVVTPSYIDSQQRADWAKKSLASLDDVIGKSYPHIVIDDTPADTNFVQPAVIYDKPNITLLHRGDILGSASALLMAVREARKQGAELCFIHLDDQVYTHMFKWLFQCACGAFKNNKDLQAVHFSGYPILIKRHTSSDLGNLTGLTISKDSISFDTISLSPTRYPTYTLWSSQYHDQMADSRLWPVMMWMTLYRVGFLQRLLSQALNQDLRSLSQVETYYRNRANWQSLINDHPGKLAYINMQFGGLDMHRHKNWQEMIAYPNIAVR